MQSSLAGDRCREYVKVLRSVRLQILSLKFDTEVNFIRGNHRNEV